MGLPFRAAHQRPRSTVFQTRSTVFQTRSTVFRTRSTVFRIAGLTAALLVSLAVAAAPDSRAASGPGNAYPMVVDLDLTPDSMCGRSPVKGRVIVYRPTGKEPVNWRVRLDGVQVAAGQTKMNGTVGTGEFTLPDKSTRPGANLLVDARTADDPDTDAAYGKVWRDTLVTGCHPLRTIAVGDSVVWGQGLDHDQKFPYLIGEQIAHAAGRGHVHLNYAISGAALDAPGDSTSDNDPACPPGVWKQDPDGDGEIEFGEISHHHRPDVFCQLEHAATNARAGHYRIDLVMLDGCINDLDPFFGVPTGTTPGSKDLPAAVRRECAGAGAKKANPARKVAHPSGAQVSYGGRGIQAAIEKAHTLPGHPKVIVVNFYYVISRSSLWLVERGCSTVGVDGPRLRRCHGIVGDVAERFEKATQLINETYRAGTEAANRASRDGAYAVAADGLFTLNNAIRTDETKVFFNPTVDPAYPLRRYACPEFNPNPMYCIFATGGHPDQAGARQYTVNLMLNPRVRAWFRLGAGGPAAAFTVRRDPSPAKVFLTARSAGGTWVRYHWYFGDGTQLKTTKTTVTHQYHRDGPYLPRLVVTDGKGGVSLVEAPEPVRVTGLDGRGEAG